MTTLPVVLLTWFSVHLAEDILREEASSRLRSTAVATALAVEKELQGLAEVVVSYSQRDLLRRALAARGTRGREGITLHLRELRQARPGVATAFVADPAGVLIDIVPPTPEIVGKDFSFRDWYRGATSERSPYVSEAYMSLAAGHPFVVAAASLVRAPGSGARGDVAGVLVAAYELDTVQGFVDEFARSQGVDLMVTDQRGVVVARPGGVPRGLIARRSDPFVAAALRGRSGTGSHGEGDDRTLTGFAPAARSGWTVTASVSEATALAGVDRLKSTIVAVGGVVGLALLAGLLLVVATLRERRRAEGVGSLLAAIVEGSDDAIIGKALDGTIVSWNAGAERQYGFAAEEVLGTSISILVPPDRAQELTEILERIGSGQRIEHLETVRVRRDGTRLDVSLTISPIWGRDGTVTGASSIGRDITERKLAERFILHAQQKAEEARRAAEHASSAKSDFLSRMSHELRTPLNAILGFAQLLEMDNLEDRQREGVEQIMRGGRHLLGQINEILDISRIEAGRLALSIEPVSVDEAVTEALELVRPLAAQRDIAVSYALSRPGHRVMADRQRLKQVLLNLLSNAVKYNRRGGSVELREVAVAGGRTRIEVADTGQGIPEADLDRIFLPFERLGADQTTIEGTGLGLALSKGLADAMGGLLDVTSRVGHGSTFSIELRDAGDQTGWEPAAGTEDSRPDSFQSSAPDATVLYIEDNLPNVRLLEHVLARRPGLSLLHADSGERGLRLARTADVHLILLDLHLPDMHGSAVLARLREDAALRDIPVVVLSADATGQQIERLLAQGASDYLTKPLEVRRLFEVLDARIARGAAAR